MRCLLLKKVMSRNRNFEDGSDGVLDYCFKIVSKNSANIERRLNITFLIQFNSFFSNSFQ